MRSLWKDYITRSIVKKKIRVDGLERNYSRYELAKGFREVKITFLSVVKNIFFICSGIVSAAFGLESFLLPNKFIDGGATGISLLLTDLTSLPLYILLLIVNIPFMFLGYTVIGKSFAFKTTLAIIGLSICVAFLHFPEVTHDKLLVSVFGGFFLGTGIGLSVRGGAVIDGTEVLAIYLSRRLGTTIGDVIVILNIMVFSAAAYLLSVETALYSMITYLVASKALDFVVEGIEEYTGVTIVSPHSEAIRMMIMEKIGRGLTVYKGKRGFGSHGERNDIDIIYTVVTRLELNKLNTEILKIDPNAFVVMNSVKDTKGGMIKKRSLKH